MKGRIGSPTWRTLMALGSSSCRVGSHRSAPLPGLRRPVSRFHRAREQHGPTHDFLVAEGVQDVRGLRERRLAGDDGPQPLCLREGDCTGEVGHRRRVGAEVRLAAVDEIICGDGNGLAPRGDGDQPTAGSEDGSSEVERGFRPDEVDRHVRALSACDLADRTRCAIRRYRQVGAGIEGRLTGFFPYIDREDPSPMDLRDLYGGEPNSARADDDCEIAFPRLAERYNGPVRGRPAASEGSREGGFQTRREWEDGRLLRDDELRIASGRVEAERGPVLAEVRPHALALPTRPAGLLEVHDDAISDVRGIHVRANFDDATGDFVTRNKRVVGARLHPVEEMEVCVAHARREDLHEDVLESRLWVRDLDEPRRPVPLEPDRTHCPPLQGARRKTVRSRPKFTLVLPESAPRRRASYGYHQHPRLQGALRGARSWTRLNLNCRERRAGRGRSTDSFSRLRSLTSSWPCWSAEGSLRLRSFSTARS